MSWCLRYVARNFNRRTETDGQSVLDRKMLYGKVKNILNVDSRKMLFHSLVNSHLLYCLPAWRCGLKSTMEPLIKLQKQAIRIVFSMKHNTNTTPLFKRINALPLHESATYFILIFMFDFINNNIPNSFHGTWIRRNQLHTRNLRNSNMFDIKKPKFQTIWKIPLLSLSRFMK